MFRESRGPVGEASILVLPLGILFVLLVLALLVGPST